MQPRSRGRPFAIVAGAVVAFAGHGCGAGSRTEDRDGDGWRSLAAGGGDCDDGDPAVHPGAAEATAWTLDTIVWGGTMVPKVAAGPDAVFVAFRVQDLNDNPWLATRGGPIWSLESLDYDEAYALGVGVVDGSAEIVFEHASDRDRLMHARRGDAGWTVDEIPGASGALFDAVVASNGHTLSAAYLTDDGALWHAQRSTLGWQASRVESAGRVTFAIWLALDAAGTAHITSRRASDLALQYSTNRSGEWETELPPVQECCARVAVGPDGEPWLAFTDGDGIAVLRRESDEWIRQRVTDAVDPNWQVTIGFDQDGRAHVLYIEEREQGPLIRLASQSETAWTVDDVFVLANENALMPALAAGARGRVDVVFYDDAAGELVHAFRSPITDGRDANCDGSDTGPRDEPTEEAVEPDGGACGHPCPLGRACCRSAEGEDACTDILFDSLSCGGCGLQCPVNEACYDGECFCGGEPSYARCGGACVLTSRSNAHCGACDHPCLAGELCLGGACLRGDGESCAPCPDGTVCCAGTDECVDPLTDEDHCGGCGAACEESASCEEARCVIWLEGQ